MKTISFILGLAASLVIGAAPGMLQAHITPPVVFISDWDAVLSMTTGAKKYFVREVRLSPEEQRAIESQWRWKPDEPFYRFFIGRDENGQLVSAVTFVTEFTIHGPVRVAVALGLDGKVKDARIVEVTEEVTTWVRPLMTSGFVQKFVGLDSRGNFAVPVSHAMSRENMVQFHGEVAEKVEECLNCDLRLETAAHPVLREAVTYCESVRDYVSRELFEDILDGEEDHID